ncbi:MAG: hypothetical protein Q4A90_06750 [Streptococcus sp.]|nr:hypothetical protein [Streptococcus sp.]
MKKKFFYALAIGCLVASFFVLSACSSSDNKKHTNDSSDQPEKKVSVGIYEHLKKAKNEIWYVVDKPTKDGVPSQIYVFNDGKVKGYSQSSLADGKTLGELSRMKDKEIIDYFESQEGTELKTLYERALGNASQFPETSQYKTMADALETYGDGKGKLPKVSFTAKLETDGTGKEIESENINIDILGVKQESDDGNFLNYTARLKHVTSTSEIYNSVYNGFETKTASFPFFITRSKDQYLLDTSGTKGIEVD